MKEIYLYLLTVPVFFGIDMLWILLVARKFYTDNIGSLMKPMPNWPAAIIFYLIYIAGIIYLVVLPNADKGVTRVLVAGAVFGLIAYATYDLTNYSTLKNWPLNVTIVDMIWGGVITGVVSVISFYIYNLLWK